MRIEDKYSADLLDYLKGFACDSWETGQPLDYNDEREFIKILKDDGWFHNVNISLNDARELLNYYFEQLNLYQERENDY